MKKLVKYVLPVFAVAILALSLSSCGGGLKGSKYENKDSKAVIEFTSTKEATCQVDGKEVFKATYAVEKTKVTFTLTSPETADSTYNIKKGDKVEGTFSGDKKELTVKLGSSDIKFTKAEAKK